MGLFHARQVEGKEEERERRRDKGQSRIGCKGGKYIKLDVEVSSYIERVIFHANK